MSLEHSPARTAKRASAEVNDPSLTVDQFCRAENISRSMLYRAWAEGWGPKFYKVGVRAASPTGRDWYGSMSAKPRPPLQ